MRDPLHWLSIRYKLAFGFVGLCLVAFGVGGYFISRSAKETLETEIMKRLAFQSQAYATDLHKSLEMLTRRTEDFASDGYIRDHLARIVNTQDPAAADTLRDHLRRHLEANKLPLESAFMNLGVVSAFGEMVTSVVVEDPAVEQGLVSWAMEQPHSAASGAFESGVDGSPGLVVSTPIRGLRSGETIGRLLTTVRVGIWISRAMQTDRLGRDRAVEDVSLHLFDGSEGQLVVPTTFLNYTGIPETTAPIVEGRGIWIIAPGDLDDDPTGSDDSTAGHIYSDRFALGSSGWEVEVHIRTNAALAPVSGLQSEFLIAGLLLSAVSLLLLYFPMHYLALPLGVLRQAAQKIRSGDFSARVEVNSEDEMGDLGRSFNLMAEAVEHRTSDLERAAHDLAERQEEVSAQRDRLDRVISTMRDGLVVIDEQGKVLLSNQSAGPLLRLLQEQDHGGSVVRRVCHESRDAGADAGCSHCLGNVSSREFSCTLEFEDKIFDVHATPLPLGNTGAFGRILVARDITLRVARDESEIHQERLVVLGEVAATMAHELNNPLASISMFNQMLETSLPPESELQENVEVIRRNTETCKRVISELLNYATGAAPEVSLVDVHDILEDVTRFLRPLAERHGVSFERHFESEHAEVRGDEVQLRQVFVNLVMNAIQAIEGGGTVSLCSHDAEGQLVFEVRDTGSGIAVDQLDQIFRPFYTTKARGQGTGLGLPTAQRITEAHGGGIELIESSESGTVFRVRLRPAGEAMAS
ncbi:MAG: sensor histidine kinase [Planctomycetota bacterium]|jgi:signal transduction histidine kinase